MVKLFKYIRPIPISENNLSKYAIYVIGQIIIAVFGVLVALQIRGKSHAV